MLLKLSIEASEDVEDDATDGDDETEDDVVDADDDEEVDLSPSFSPSSDPLLLKKLISEKEEENQLRLAMSTSLIKLIFFAV